jgi:hypothetical protein
VWLAPVWLTVLITTLVVVGLIVGWVVEDLKAGEEPGEPA